MDTLNNQLMQAWTIYISFFTVFLTVNVTALGVVATRVPLGWARRIICLVFLMENIIAVGTGIYMAKYTRLVEASFALAGAPELTSFGDLGWWGGVGNAIGNGLLGLAWVFLMFLKTIDNSPGKDLLSS